MKVAALMAEAAVGLMLGIAVRLTVMALQLAGAIAAHVLVRYVKHIVCPGVRPWIHERGSLSCKLSPLDLEKIVTEAVVVLVQLLPGANITENATAQYALLCHIFAELTRYLANILTQLGSLRLLGTHRLVAEVAL